MSDYNEEKCYNSSDETKQFYTADTFYWGSSKRQ